MLAGKTVLRVGTKVKITKVEGDYIESQSLVGLTGSITHPFTGLMFERFKDQYICGIQLDTGTKYTAWSGNKVNLLEGDEFEIVYTQEEIEELWMELEDRTFIEDKKSGDSCGLVLASNFEHFKKGQTRDSIWNWFSKNYEKGFEYLTNMEYGFECEGCSCNYHLKYRFYYEGEALCENCYEEARKD